MASNDQPSDERLEVTDLGSVLAMLQQMMEQQRQEAEANREWQRAMLGSWRLYQGNEPPTPTPIGSAARPRPPFGREPTAARSQPISPSRDTGTRAWPTEFSNADVYATPTGPRYRRGPIRPIAMEEADGEEPKVLKADIKIPFPKLDTKDVELFLIKANNWFTQYGIANHQHRVAIASEHLEGSARGWWDSKLRVDPLLQGQLFHDWDMFCARLRDQYGQTVDSFMAYAELSQLRQASDEPGAATQFVERFRDLANRAGLDENPKLIMGLLKSGLTGRMRQKFERDPPADLWGWYRGVEEIDRTRTLDANNARLLASTVRPAPTPTDRRRAKETPAPVTGRPSGWVYRPAAGPGPRPPLQRPLPSQPAQRLPTTRFGGTTFGPDQCALCGQTGHWRRDCPQAESRGQAPNRTSRGPPFQPTRAPGPQQNRVYLAHEEDEGLLKETATSEEDSQADEAVDLAAYVGREDPESQEDGDDPGNVTGATH